MKVSDHEDLFKRYQSGEVSPEERVIVEDYILNNRFNELRLSEEELEAITARLAQRIGRIADGERQAVPLYRRWRGIAAVAAAVAAIGFGVYFFNANRHANTPPRNEFGAGSQDIAPGKNGATITLGNGKVIQLSDAKSGVIVGGGKLAYYPSLRGGDPSLRSGQAAQSHDEIASIPRNDGEGKQQITASTAKGQTYQFTLPDGTKVWLNADSKISFPSQFIGKQRKVLLNGEGYFEVSKDKAHPFIVETDQQIVEVLGTHFNINSYKDEGAVRTTLLEGSVRISRHLDDRRDLLNSTNKRSLPAVRDDGEGKARAGASKGAEVVVLKPSQQSVVSGSNRIAVKEIDPAEAIAWKNGKFVFEYENIESVMRKLSRWYDAEIIYQGNFGDKTFTGSISRRDNISKILEKITYTQNVHFKIEGRRITVMP